MPVTIKTGVLNYKDSYDQYVGVDVVADNTTASRVAAINSTANTKLTAIEQTGADTINQVETAVADSQAAVAGIDAQRNTMIAAIASVAGQGTDTTLSQSGVAADAKAVGDLKSAIDADESQIFEEIGATWESGGFNVETGEKNTNNSRIRAQLPEKADMITSAPDYFVTILAFSGETYIGIWDETTFKPEGHRIKHAIDVTLLRQYDYDFWLMCGKDNNATITASDGSNIQIYVNRINTKILIAQQDMMQEEDVAWEQGQFNVTTGEFSTVSTRIRSKIDPLTTGIVIADNAYLTIGAWSGDTYVGVWNGMEYKKEGCRLHGRIDTRFFKDTNYEYWVFGGLDNGGNISPSDSGNYQILYFENTKKIENLEAQTFTNYEGDWLWGGYNVTTGEYLSVNYRIRQRLNRNAVKITADNGIFATLLAFSGSEYIGVWNGEEFKAEGYRITKEMDVTPLLEYNYDYWLMAGKTAGGTISYSDGENIGVICNKPLYISDKRSNSFSQSPNIIFQCRNVDNTKFPPESKWYVKAAAENQYDRVRFTVRKTTGGDYFLCHDETINNVARNMDGTEIVGSVSTINQSLEVLNSYDWGIKYGEQYRGATVPMLEDSLKWAALFNMGVTWHSGYYDCQTPEAIAEQLAMIDKYGLTDNLIAIVVGSSPDTLKIFTDYNPRISVYLLGALGSVQGAQDFTNQTTLEKMSALQTPYNKIYVQPAPFGTKPSAEFIAYAKQHNWVLYDSITQTLSAFCDVDMFSRGYGIREVENVYMIKDTLRKWVNNMF